MPFSSSTCYPLEPMYILCKTSINIYFFIFFLKNVFLFIPLSSVLLRPQPTAPLLSVSSSGQYKYLICQEASFCFSDWGTYIKLQPCLFKHPQFYDNEEFKLLQLVQHIMDLTVFFIWPFELLSCYRFPKRPMLRSYPLKLDSCEMRRAAWPNKHMYRCCKFRYACLLQILLHPYFPGLAKLS